MTPRQVINLVDDMKKNSFSIETKVYALNQLEQRIMHEVFYMAPVEVKKFALEYPDCLDHELIVDPPHDDMYEAYLCAWVDEHNTEAERYGNSAALFNAKYDNFVHWFKNMYAPMQGYISEERRLGRYGYMH